MSLRARLEADETLISAWSGVPDALTVEIVAKQDFDCVTLDMQHGGHNEDSVLRSIAPVLAAAKPAIVRIPVGRFDMASRALDFGAEGIVAPMINNAEDARRFAAAAKYPPLGERSFGPPRAMMLQGQMAATDYLAAANAGTLTFAMIETPEALRNVEEIAGTPGIDALFIGPYDLSTSLSAGKAQDIEAPEVNVAIDKICAAAIAAGKIPGIYCRDARRALDMAKRGFRFMTVGSDFSLVREGASGALKQLPVQASGAKDAF